MSLWRNVTAGGLNDKRGRLNAGINALKKYRDKEGRWGRFPFYYTLLALTEIEGTAAKKEKQYAAHVLEKFLKRKGKHSRYGARRRMVAERILSQV